MGPDQLMTKKWTKAKERERSERGEKESQAGTGEGKLIGERKNGWNGKNWKFVTRLRIFLDRIRRKFHFFTNLPPCP
jgi:hypothetical protein